MPPPRAQSAQLILTGLRVLLRRASRPPVGGGLPASADCAGSVAEYLLAGLAELACTTFSGRRWVLADAELQAIFSSASISGAAALGSWCDWRKALTGVSACSGRGGRGATRSSTRASRRCSAPGTCVAIPPSDAGSAGAPGTGYGFCPEVPVSSGAAASHVVFTCKLGGSQESLQHRPVWTFEARKSPGMNGAPRPELPGRVCRESAPVRSRRLASAALRISRFRSEVCPWAPATVSVVPGRLR